MSTPFRKNIEAARDAYGSLKYPGDLAGEMLTTSPRTQSRWILAALGAAAVAAMVTVLVMIQPGSDQDGLVGSGPDELAMSADPLDQPEIVQVSFSQMPGMTPPRAEGLADLAPETPMMGFGAAPDFSFSAPSFTLINSSDEEQQQENFIPTGAVYVPSNNT
jgi:hypothetical protein